MNSSTDRARHVLSARHQRKKERKRKRDMDNLDNDQSAYMAIGTTNSTCKQHVQSIQTEILFSRSTVYTIILQSVAFDFCHVKNSSFYITTQKVMKHRERKNRYIEREIEREDPISSMEKTKNKKKKSFSANSPFDLLPPRSPL